MHSIDLSKIPLRTDLIIEDKNYKKHNTNREIIDNIIIERSTTNKEKDKYTTIIFDDITDKDNYQKVENVLINELKPYIDELNLSKKEPILVIGLGNSNSTPDSLGPKTIENILVTRYLFSLGEVEDGYQNVAAIAPEVTATTGIETKETIKSLINTINAKGLIVIDALASTSISRLNKIIQITNTGIHPGSGVGNNREGLTEKTLNIPVIAIGIPTIVEATTIVYDTFKSIDKQFSFKLKNYKNNSLKLIPPNKIDYSKENSTLTSNIKKEILGEIGLLDDSDLKKLIYEVLTPINYNLMVTPAEIDFLIKKLSILIGNSINKTLHKNFIPTNN